MGGSSSASSGAATNYLCLTLTPVLTEPPPARGLRLFGRRGVPDEDQHENNDPLCAVCRSPRATTVMLPTTNEYVCVDAQFEERAGSEANKNGKLLYYTVAHCELGWKRQEGV
nr:hypothetical protein BaRGS_005842 [Batillaria attramentaria]